MTVDLADVQGWAMEFEQLRERFGSCFHRTELRQRAMDYLRGLLGKMDRKNSWQLAEYVGNTTPHGIQRLLDRASWDANKLQVELSQYAKQHLLSDGEHGNLIIDETGFLKKGDKSAGVQRQYSGTAGRIENCQIGVFLAMSSSRGRALIDRELYVPKSWTDDPARMKKASIPAETPFMTKQVLAKKMLQRAFDAGFSPRWVLADEVYGSDSKFRRFLESHNQPYVLAVSCQQRLFIDGERKRLDVITQEIPVSAWFRMSVADGTKGPRVYDWTAGRFGPPCKNGLVQWLLVRRSVESPDALAYYFCLAPAEATAADLAIAAGGRWAIECCFESAKQETGLDEYEVRSWHGWHRHITLSMLAMIFLSVIRSQAANAPDSPKKTTLHWCR